jgi:hypothetical protein
LKLDEFRHEHLSQLNTYVSCFREEIKQENDNPPIGILMCTEKGKKLVEYALSGMDEKLFVSKYLVELPSKETLTAFIELFTKCEKQTTGAFMFKTLLQLVKDYCDGKKDFYQIVGYSKRV